MQRDFATIPDALWKRVEALIPTHAKDPRGGRTRVPDRTVMSGILYRLRTGCQWDAIPREFGSGSTCYRRFVEWQKAGVFHRMHGEMLRFYDEKRGSTGSGHRSTARSSRPPKGGSHGAQSDRSGQAGDQAPCLDRWPRGSDRHHDHGSERPRQVDGWQDARCSCSSGSTGTPAASAHLSRQGLRLR